MLNNYASVSNFPENCWLKSVMKTMQVLKKYQFLASKQCLQDYEAFKLNLLEIIDLIIKKKFKLVKLIA